MAIEPASIRGEWIPPSFDDFVMLGPLGRGGMGRVYLARDTALDRPVALKVIAASNPTEAMRRRFVIEARAIARIAHPNVVSVYRIGEVLGRPYVAYELVTGHSLDRLPKPLPWVEALRIGLGMARGLEAAHKGGVLHRDIKPGNVMLSVSGDVKILDFGLAKLDMGTAPDAEFSSNTAAESSFDPAAFARQLAHEGRLMGEASTLEAEGVSRAGALMGTPLYIAPEQWQGELASVRSDLYAVGLVLYELLSGESPYAGLGGEALVKEVTSTDLPSVRLRCSDVPESLAQIVDRCVRREPAERFSTAEKLRSSLEDLSAVFLTGVGGRPLLRMDGHARVVALSFARVLPRLEEVTEELFSRLFALKPSLRSLFPPDLNDQRRKLAHALRLSVEGLREPERLIPVLEDLGRRHSGYGITVEDFGFLGEILLQILSEYDTKRFDEEVAIAWRRAYDFIAIAMLRGMRDEVHTDLSSELAPRRASPLADESGPIPRTQYALSKTEKSVAYQVFGDGPVDLVMCSFVCSVELLWQHPAVTAFFRRLGRLARVIVFDPSGIGLSDKSPGEPHFNDRVDDLEVILNATRPSVGARPVVIFGVAEGCWATVTFAARFAERVHGLILFGLRGRMIRSADYPFGPGSEAIDPLLKSIRQNWGKPVFVHQELPSLAGNDEFVEWYARFIRTSAGPGTAVALIKAHLNLDVRASLGQIRAPTLFLQMAEDYLCPPAAGRYLASLIQDVQWVEIPGGDRLPFAGEAETVLAHVERFLREFQGGQVISLRRAD